MNFHDLLMQVLQYVIEAGLAVLVPVAINYLVSKLGAEKFQKYQSLAAMVVAAVQQSMDSADNQAKKDAAVARLANMTKGALAQEDIEHLIESAVYNLKKDAAAAVQK